MRSPVVPNDDNSATDVTFPDSRSANVLRVVVYVVAVVAFCIAIWAIVDGGGRDLWTQSSSLGLPLIASAPNP